MTIEAVIKKLADEATRIADALEALVASQGVVSTAGTQGKLALDDDDDELEEEEADDDDDLGDDDELEEEDLDDDDDLGDDDELEEEEEEKPVKKKAAKKKAAKKKTSKAASKKESSPTVEDVRKALSDLQTSQGSPAKPKAILKKNGATNLKNLDPGKYAAVIKSAKAATK